MWFCFHNWNLVQKYFLIAQIHDDVIKWKHFPRYWPFTWGIHRLPLNSPHKGQLRAVLMFSMIFAWINAWVNNREPGDLRRHRAHYDVIVMSNKVIANKFGTTGVAGWSKTNHSDINCPLNLNCGSKTLQWRHNEHDGVSKSPSSWLFAQPLVMVQIQETPTPRVTSLCEDPPPPRWPVDSPHKWPVTRTMFSIWWCHHERLWNGTQLEHISQAIFHQ